MSTATKKPTKAQERTRKNSRRPVTLKVQAFKKSINSLNEAERTAIIARLSTPKTLKQVAVDIGAKNAGQASNIEVAGWEKIFESIDTK